MGGNYQRVLRSASLRDLYDLAKRILGLPYLAREDFFPQIEQKDQARISDLARRARGDGPAPLLVFGVMPRSGTNFLRDVLAMHPDVLGDPGGVHEFPLLHAAHGATRFMDEYISYFPANAEVTSQWDALALLSGAWLREFQAEAGSQHILLKCPHVQNVTLAPWVFPGSKIVLCIRDGRDVVDSTLNSFSRLSLTRKTFGQLAREWRLSTQAVLAFAPGGTYAHPDVLVVRYEDLVETPEDMVRRLLEHTGLSLESFPFDRLASMPVRGSSRSQAQEAERWKPQEKTADFNPVRRWEAWSASKKSKFDRLAGDTLEAAGYER